MSLQLIFVGLAVYGTPCTEFFVCHAVEVAVNHATDCAVRNNKHSLAAIFAALKLFKKIVNTVSNGKQRFLVVRFICKLALALFKSLIKAALAFKITVVLFDKAFVCHKIGGAQAVFRENCLHGLRCFLRAQKR